MWADSIFRCTEGFEQMRIQQISPAPFEMPSVLEPGISYLLEFKHAGNNRVVIILPLGVSGADYLQQLSSFVAMSDRVDYTGSQLVENWITATCTEWRSARLALLRRQQQEGNA